MITLYRYYLNSLLLGRQQNKLLNAIREKS
uniref:Uncharacterized protein n=1 Tax=Rhizophora mucronata TaxID=61149 RepID=A0A2P2PB70_RHIMU